MLKILNLSKNIKKPDISLNIGRNLVMWGKDNLYPLYLYDLYTSNETTHKAIINKKVKMISVKGLNIEDEELKKSIDRKLPKLALDLVLFNAMAVEIVYNRSGEVYEINPIPVMTVRKGYHNNDEKTIKELGDEFYWISDDWKQYRKEEYKPKYIRGWNPYVPKAGRYLYWYQEYNPKSLDRWEYPIPEYINAIASIETGNEIAKYHLDDIRNGFLMNTLVNFSNGEPSDQIKEQFYDDFTREFSGSEGLKLFVTYSDGKEFAPEILPFELSASDTRFEQLEERVQTNIIRAHEIPQQLLTITSGSLSDTSHRMELLQEFQLTYISNRQNVIENALNDIYLRDDIEIADYLEDGTDARTDELKEAEARANIRGSVGGINGILDIRRSIAEGIISLDNGVSMLENIYGFEEEVAIKMLKNKEDND